MDALANFERIGIYQVTEALVALYTALKDRNRCSFCKGEGMKVVQRFDGPDCVACACVKNLQSVETKFATVFELAERHNGTATSAALYSILVPGLGLCRCLDAVQRLHTASAQREDCPTCRGMGRSFRYDPARSQTIERQCACVTAVDAALVKDEHCYQAALGAWMEWHGVDETPSASLLLELIAKGG